VSSNGRLLVSMNRDCHANLFVGGLLTEWISAEW